MSKAEIPKHWEQEPYKSPPETCEHPRDLLRVEETTLCGTTQKLILCLACGLTLSYKGPRHEVDV